MKRKPSATQPSSSRNDITRLEDIPNVGPAVAADLRQLGITSPGDLPGRDLYAIYDDLCRITGQRNDPCLLDTFIAAVRFMEGEPKKPWWKYTTERKKVLAARDDVIRSAGKRLLEEPASAARHASLRSALICSNDRDLDDRRLEVLLDNARRFAAGQPLRNVVDKARWF